MGGGAGTCFSKRGNNELPFYLAVWLAGDVGDVVAGPPGITAPVGAHGRGAEGQRRAMGEHRSCAAEKLTCRCVDFRDHDVVPARVRHGGSKKKRSSAGTSQKGWGRPTSNRRGVGARAPPGATPRPRSHPRRAGVSPYVPHNLAHLPHPCGPRVQRARLSRGFHTPCLQPGGGIASTVVVQASVGVGGH